MGSFAGSCSVVCGDLPVDCSEAAVEGLFKSFRGTPVSTKLFLMFPFYLGVTFGVLICMDSL